MKTSHVVVGSCGVAIYALCWSVLIAACTIRSPSGLSCKNNVPCPPLQVCGPDQVCRPEGHEVVSSADSGVPAQHADASALPLRDGGETVADPSKVQCQDELRRCGAENTPEVCVDGAWTAMAACSGSTPACTNGVCSVAKFSGSLTTTRQLDVAPVDMQLVDHGFYRATPTCARTAGGAEICVYGGFEP